MSGRQKTWVMNHVIIRGWLVVMDFHGHEVRLNDVTLAF
jgi:hypothetical protein